MKHPVVAVALSGGVDSLVSGYLLKQKYRHVFGLHFITGYEKTLTNTDRLEKQLGFPVLCIDLSKKFEDKVIEYFIGSYLDGKTPNPCLMCNKEIKFGELLRHAQDMGADFLATGHYATIVNPVSFPERNLSHSYLEKGFDPIKDQSYFLSFLSAAQLERIIFPLAGMKKTAVKQFAASHRIAPTQPKESQDICFIHNNDFSQFILDKKAMVPENGFIVDLKGNVVGRHQGLHKYTIGQRRGLNCPAKEPYYVKKIDVMNNKLIVCFKKDLAGNKLTVSQINWNYSADQTILDVTTKIRYSHKGGKSTLYLEKNRGQVLFDEPQNAITPGQAAVFYKGARVLGAGIIQ